MRVDRDAMKPAQRAAWDRLWKVLLAPSENECHENDSREKSGTQPENESTNATVDNVSDAENQSHSLSAI